MATQVISVTEFKAKCLSLLDQVKNQGNEITITKRGVPVAVVKPAKKVRYKSPAGMFAGRAKIIGDIVHTDDLTELWEMVHIEEEVKRENASAAGHKRRGPVADRTKAPVARSNSGTRSRRAAR